MSEPLSHPERRASLDRLLMEVSLLAKELCPGARVEATTATYEDEDGHVRVYPPTGLSRTQIEEIEGSIADRCVDILVDTGLFLCSAVYDSDR